MLTAPLFIDEIFAASSPLCVWMCRWFCFQHGIATTTPTVIKPLAEDVSRFLEQDGLGKDKQLVLHAVFRYLSTASTPSSSKSLSSLVEEARVQMYQDVSTQRFQKTLHSGLPATMADAYRLHTQLRLRFLLRQPYDDQEEREEGEVVEEEVVEAKEEEDEEPLLLRKVYATLTTSFDPTFVRRFLQHGYGLSIAHVAGMAYVQGLSYRAPGFQRELFAGFLRNHTATISTSTSTSTTTTSLAKDEVIDLFRFFLMQHDYAPFAVSPERYLEWFYLMQHDYLLSSNLEWMQDHNTIFVNEAGLALWHAYRRTCQRELYRQEQQDEKEQAQEQKEEQEQVPNEVVVVIRKRSLEQEKEEDENQKEHEEAHTSQEEQEDGDDDDDDEDREEEEDDQQEEQEQQEHVNNNVYDATTYLQNDRRGRRGIFTKEEDALLLSLRHQRLAYKEIRAHPLLAKFSIKQLSNRGYKRIRGIFGRLFPFSSFSSSFFVRIISSCLCVVDDADAPIQRKPKRAHIQNDVYENDVQNDVQNDVRNDVQNDGWQNEVRNDVCENDVCENDVQNDVRQNKVQEDMARLYCDDHGLGKTLWRIRRMLQQRNDIWEPDSASLLQERVLTPLDDESWHQVVRVVAQLCSRCAGNQAHLLFVHGLVLVAVDELLQQQQQQQHSTKTFAQLCANVGPKLASLDYDFDRVRQHAAERILVHGLLIRLNCTL